MERQRPSIDKIRQALDYNAETGVLTWKVRSASMFREGRVPADALATIWNKRFAGKQAFAQTDRDGYKVGTLFNSCYPAHQVIWAIVHGEWSTCQMPVDHKNGRKDDNRLTNLRRITCQQNQSTRVRKAYRNGGARCVTFNKANDKWQASIRLEPYKHRYIGSFNTKAEAIAARDEAERAML